MKIYTLKIIILLKKITLGAWKKIIDFVNIFLAFIFISWTYYLFTWINYSNFTYNQIEEFIVQDLPNDNFETLIYKKDLKWYWEDSLIILTKSNMDDLDTYPFSQKHMDKIYIFDKVQKWPIENLLFWWDIYKKTYVIEFPVKCFSEWEEFQIFYWKDCYDIWLAEKHWYLNSYHYSKSNNFVGKVNFIKYDDRNKIIVSFYTPQWLLNPTDYGFYIISYDLISWYSALPLIHDFSNFTINDDWEVIDYYEKEKYPILWLHNKNYKMIINNELKEIELSFIDMDSWDIKFKEDNSFELRVFNFNTCIPTGNWYPWECEFYKVKYGLWEDVFYKQGNAIYIKKWTEEYNNYYKLGWKQ